jgi:hypothetical protein
MCTRNSYTGFVRALLENLHEEEKEIRGEK